MKIAFATQDLKRVDAHFGWAKNIAIYEIGPQGHRFLEAIRNDFPTETATEPTIVVSQPTLPSEPKVLVLPGL